MKTGIDLVGEESGLIFSEDRLNPVELATSSFGQGLKVTMIQMVTAFSALVNGGHYYEPHLVKQIENENGAVVETIGPTLAKEIVSKKTSDLINTYLLATVDEGTAGGAKVPGYTVGGKTGTAEKLPRKNKKYLVSFLGCVPAEDPELVIYVIIDEPNVEKQDDSKLATNKAGDILREILPFLEIYPTGDVMIDTETIEGTDSLIENETAETENPEESNEETQTNPDEEEEENETPEDDNSIDSLEDVNNPDEEPPEVEE